MAKTKLTQEIADAIRLRLSAGENVQLLSQEYQIDRSQIYRIGNKEIWVGTSEGSKGQRGPNELTIPTVRSIPLACGGTITLTLNANVFDLLPEELDMLRGLIEVLQRKDDR